MSAFDVIYVVDVIDMIIDFEKLPMNGRTSKLRNNITQCEIDLYLDKPGALKRLEKAVQEYYNYAIECRKKAQYENQI